MFNFSTESRRSSKRRGGRRITGWTELRKGGLKYRNISLKYKEQLLEKRFFSTYHGKIFATGFLPYISQKNPCNWFSSLQVMEQILQQVFFLTYHKKILAIGFLLYISWKNLATGFLPYISRTNLCNRFFSLYVCISWTNSATNFLCYISRKNPCNCTVLSFLKLFGHMAL